MRPDVLPDPEALLVALVLAPGSFPRNRFFRLYRDPRFQEVRRRAAELRGTVRLLAGSSKRAAEIDETTTDEAGTATIRYRVDALNLRGTLTLDPLEHAILLVAIARARSEAPPDVARHLVEDALHRLTTPIVVERAEAANEE